MDEWDFECGTFEFEPSDDFFRRTHEKHESETPRTANLFSDIFGRLSCAIERRKTFTIDFYEAFPQDNHNEEVLSEINKNSKTAESKVLKTNFNILFTCSTMKI